MKQQIKSVLLRVPFGNKLADAYRSYTIRKNLIGKNPQDIFTEYCEKNSWGSEESVSGPGSTIEYTENLRKELPSLLSNLKIKLLLDAPCGDYNWFRLVPRGENIHYIGGDIVENLIRKNKENYENQNTTFIHLDIIEGALPDADLWMCRDVFLHFSYKDIFLTLNNFLESKIPYLLASSHTECRENTDILTGSGRLLNLEESPFNFPKPMLYIDDWIEGFPVRKLCLWDKETLKEHLINNESYKKINDFVNKS